MNSESWTAEASAVAAKTISVSAETMVSYSLRCDGF